MNIVLGAYIPQKVLYNFTFKNNADQIFCYTGFWNNKLPRQCWVMQGTVWLKLQLNMDEGDMSIFIRKRGYMYPWIIWTWCEIVVGELTILFVPKSHPHFFYEEYTTHIAYFALWVGGCSVVFSSLYLITSISL